MPPAAGTALPAPATVHLCCLLRPLLPAPPLMRSPLFVLPLAKPGGGFLTMVSQCQSPFVLLTTLEEYRRCEPAGCGVWAWGPTCRQRTGLLVRCLRKQEQCESFPS